jgi:hypothetical protein
MTLPIANSWSGNDEAFRLYSKSEARETQKMVIPAVYYGKPKALIPTLIIGHKRLTNGNNH